MAESLGSLRVSIGLESADLTRGLADINRKLGALNSEFKATMAGAGKFDNSLDTLNQKANVLNRTLQVHKAKLTDLKRQYEESARTKGKDAAASVRLLTQYNKALAAMRKTEDQLDLVNKRIKEQSTGFAQLGAKLNASVNTITTKMRALDAAFKASTAGVDNFGSTSDQLRQKADHLNKSMNLQQQRLKDLRRLYLEAKRAKGEDAQETQELSARMHEATAQLRETQAQLRTTNTQIERQANAWSRMGDRANETGARMRTFGGNMQSIGSEIAMSFGAAAVAIGGALGLATKKSMDFEQQMSYVKSVMNPDDANKYSEALTNLAIKLGADTKYSALEAAQGMEELVKAGVSTQDILNGGLSGALSLATAGGLELADAAEIASTALNAFRDDNLSVAQAADILAGAANSSATDVQEMKYGLAMTSAVAAGMGLTFKDTATALAVFAQNGLKGSDAGTSLKTMLSRLVPMTEGAYTTMESLGLVALNTNKAFKVLSKEGFKPASKDLGDIYDALDRYVEKSTGLKKGTDKFEKAFSKASNALGIMDNKFFDANGNIRTMTEISGELSKALDGMTAKDKQEALYTIFGSDAIRGALILGKQGAKGFNEMAKAMSKIKAADVAAERMNNLKGKIEELSGAFETAQINIGNALTPVISAVVGGLQKLLDAFNGLSPGMQKFISISLAVGAVLTTLVAAFGVILGIVGAAVTGFGAIAEAVGALSLALASAGGIAGVFGTALAAITGPVGITIAAIVALGTAFVVAYKKVEWFRTSVNYAMNKVRDGFESMIEITKSVWQVITRYVSDGIAVFKALFSGDFKKAGQLYVKMMQNLGKSLVNVGKVYLTQFKKMWGTELTNITNIIREKAEQWGFGPVLEKMGQSLKLFFDVAKKMVRGIVTYTSNVISIFTNLLTGDFSGAFEAVKKTIADSGKDTQAIARTYFGGLKDIFGPILTGMKNATVKKLGEWKTAIIDFFTGLPGATQSKLEEWGAATAEWFKSLPSRLFDTSFNLGKTVGEWFRGSKSTVTEALNEWGVAIDDWFTSLPGRIIKKLKGWKQALSDWGAEQNKENIRQFSEWGRSIVDFFTTMRDTIVKKAGELGEAVGNWFTGIPERTQNQFNAWGQTIGSWFEQRKTDITNKLTGWGEVISGWFTKRPEESNKSLANWWSSISAWFTSIPAKITAVLSGWGKEISDFFTFAPEKPEVKNAGKKIVDNVAKSAQSKPLMDKLGKIIVDSAGFAVGIIAIAFVAVGREIIKRIMSGVTSLSFAFLDLLTKLKNSAVGKFLQLRDQAGQKVVDLKNRVIKSAVALKDGLVSRWNSAKNAVVKLAGQLKDSITSRFNSIVEGAKKLPGRIGEGIRNMAHKAVSGIASLGKSMIGKMKGVVNNVIGGINWVLRKVNMKDSQLPLWAPKYAQGTGASGHPGGPAIVGDGGMQEAVVLPSGRSFLSPATDTLIPNLPKGSQVISGPNTKKLMRQGLPAYKSGKGWLNEAIDGIGGFVGKVKNTAKNVFSKAKSTVAGTAGKLKDGAKNVVTKVKDTAVDVWNLVSNPKKLFQSILDKYGITGLDFGGDLKSLGKGVYNKIKGSLYDFLKKKTANVFKFDAANATGNVKKWVAEALKIKGLDSRYASALETIAMKESGGNPNTVNRWDSNWKAGHPSQGLMQFIPSTFNAYKQSGYGDIKNPVHQVIAAINYLNKRYGGILKHPGLVSMSKGGPYRGYKDGGTIQSDQWAWVGEQGKELVRLPGGSRVYPHQRSTKMAGETGQVSGGNEVVEQLLERLVSVEQRSLAALNIIAQKDPSVRVDKDALTNYVDSSQAQQATMKRLFRGDR